MIDVHERVFFSLSFSYLFLYRQWFFTQLCLTNDLRSRIAQPLYRDEIAGESNGAAA